MDPSSRHDRRRTRPYLSDLDGEISQSVTVMEWARYLAATFGTDGAISALRYYEDVNWINRSVRRTMVDYVRGLSLDELSGDDGYEVDLDEPLDTLAGTPFEEHAKSVEYIAAIGGDSLERDLLPLRIPEDHLPGTSEAPVAGAADDDS